MRARDIVAVKEWLRDNATVQYRDGLMRHGIDPCNALGVSVPPIRRLAKEIGRDHRLAAGLGKTGCHEARLLAAFVDDPAEVTPAPMDRWACDFDNRAVCDTVCTGPFPRTLHERAKVHEWSRNHDEFARRAAFSLVAGLAVHERAAGDQSFLDALPLIERESSEARNFVKKGVTWALRSMGRRGRMVTAAADPATRLPPPGTPLRGHSATKRFASTPGQDLENNRRKAKPYGPNERRIHRVH